MADSEKSYILIDRRKLAEMVGQRDRPQQVLDFIDFIWKLTYGEVLR